MGAATKGRRTITIAGERFLWSLHEEDLNYLHIVAHDKRLNLRYGWQHGLPAGESFVDVLGSRFEGLPSGIQGWVRIQSPSWPDIDNLASPRLVRALIEWALAPKEHVVYKELPAGFSTHASTASPWAGGPPTFSSSPGHPKVYRQQKA